MERHSFRIALVDLPETMRKLCLSTKFPHQVKLQHLHSFGEGLQTNNTLYTIPQIKLFDSKAKQKYFSVHNTPPSFLRKVTSTNSLLTAM